MIKDYASLVGMPDKKDKENLEFIIGLFERKFPGYIELCVKQEKDDEIENAGGQAFLDPHLIKSHKSGLRKVLAMPPELVNAIVDAYPTMFKDKEHFHWFVRNFPMFRIAEKESF
jgi:hypothetical protein